MWSAKIELRHARRAENGGGRTQAASVPKAHLFFERYTIIAASRLMARSLDAEVRSLLYTLTATCPPSLSQCAA